MAFRGSSETARSRHGVQNEVDSIDDSSSVGAVTLPDGRSGGGAKGACGTGEGSRRDQAGDSVPGRGEGLSQDLGAGFIESHKESARLYSYLNEKGYMPMMGAFYKTEVFVDDEFREGNVSPQAGHVAV